MILEHARQDVRYALRGLGRSPGFTATVVLTFALGVGANAAVFSVIEPLLLRTPPGLVRSGQLHRVYHVGSGEATPLFSGAAYSAIREALAGQATVSPRLYTDSATMVAGDVTMDVTREVATAAYLPTLTGPAVLGRYFTAEEGDARAPLPRAVLSYAFWQSAFGGDRNVIGREATVGAVSYTIVGVADKEFRGLDLATIDLWTTPVNFARFPEPWS